jgi:hypothetical protein
MKKLLVIGGILFIGAIIAVFVIADQLAHKTVSFTLEESGYTVEITQDDKVMNRIAKTSDVRLKEGDYSYRIIDQGYDTTRTDFSIKSNDINITVTPQLSSEKLGELLMNERSDIASVLLTAYPSSNISIDTLKLYKKGEWAAGTLQNQINPRQIPDTYRFILEKKDNQWNIVVSPRIAIKRADFPSIPADIIYSLYSSTPSN